MKKIFSAERRLASTNQSVNEIGPHFFALDPKRRMSRSSDFGIFEWIVANLKCIIKKIR